MKLHTYTRFYSFKTELVTVTLRHNTKGHLKKGDWMSNKKGLNMKKVLLGVQMLAGLMLVVFGLNKFLHFITMAAPTPEMGAYLGALAATDFLFPLIAVIEITAGLAFLVNKYVSLMVLIVIPVMVNAFLAHLFLDPSGIGGAAFILFVLISIIVNHKDRYTEIFKA